MTDKDREDAIPSDPKKLAEMVLHHIKLGDIRCYRCEMTAKKVIETHDYELSRISTESKAKALRDAADRLRNLRVDVCHVMNGPREKWYSKKSINLEDALTCILDGEPQSSCIWTETTDGLWETSCGRTWTFLEGGPKDNRFSYCHGCGKPVRIAEKLG